MTDVLLFQTNDGGEINYINGNPEMTDGLETAVYLSLFGGNLDDLGTAADDSKQWWGNVDETVPERRYRSETQALVLRGFAVVTSNLPTIEDAAQRDLAWLVSTGIAGQIEVEASVPGFNRLALEVSITQGDSEFAFSFTQAVE